VAASDHDVIDSAQHQEPAGLPATAVLSAKAAINQTCGGQIWAQPVAAEKAGTADHDSTVTVECNVDAPQRLPVIDAAAAGLAHPVRGHDADSLAQSPLHQCGVRRATPDQNGTKAGQSLAHLRTLQRTIQLCRNQRDVASLGQPGSHLWQICQIGTR
jgi:hypothetical protein